MISDAPIPPAGTAADWTIPQDFGPVYDALEDQPDIAIDTILPGDRVYHRGTRAPAAATT